MSGNLASEQKERTCTTHWKIRGARHAHQYTTPAEHQDGEESIDRKAYEEKGAEGLTRQLRVCRDGGQGRVLVPFEVGVRLEANSRSVAPGFCHGERCQLCEVMRHPRAGTPSGKSVCRSAQRDL